jgi:hypothetical protein
MTTKQGEAGEAERTRTRIVYQSLPYVERVADPSQHKMLFMYSDVSDSLQEKLTSWLSAYKVFQPALALYFSARAGEHKYLDSRFLSLAQAIETYHRRTSNEQLMDGREFGKLVATQIDACPTPQREWLEGRLAYGNELNLRKRLKQILDPFKESFGDRTARKRFVDSILTTRNYLMHYDVKLKDKAARGEDLYRLCLRMEVLLQLHFLFELGFAVEEVAAFASRVQSIAEKLRY